MTLDYHILISLTTILLGLIGYFFYFRSIFRGETKPHIFTWLSYALLDSIVFLAQVLKGAGPGAWTLGFSIFACLVISMFALKWGEKHITRSDWVCFVGAIIAIALWRLTSDPLLAVCISALANVFALVPTFRKSFVRPWEESISMWNFDIAKYALSVFALSSLNLTTGLFPIVVVVCNGTLVVMILLRRRQLATVASV